MIEPVDHSEVANSTASQLRRSAPMDDLGLVEAVDRSGEGIVVKVADASGYSRIIKAEANTSSKDLFFVSTSLQF